MSAERARVLYFANHLRPATVGGGSRSRLQVEALNRSDEVTAVIPYWDPLNGCPLDRDAVPEAQIRAAWSLKPMRGSLLGRAAYAISCVVGQIQAGVSEVLKARPRVIVGMYAPPTSAIVPALLSRLLRVPFVLDVRDLPTETALEIGYLRRGPILWLLRMCERFALSSAARITTVSHGMMRILERRRVPAERLEWVPIGSDREEMVNTSGMDTEAPALIAEREATEDVRPLLAAETRTVLMYSGTVGHIPDWATALEAMALLGPEYGLVVVGDGQLLPDLQREAQVRRLNVAFTGRVAKARVPHLLSAADFAFYPLKGGEVVGAMLGNKVFDYLGAGKPIVYYGPRGDLHDLIQELDCGVSVDAGGAPALARAIRTLATRSDQDAMARRGADFAARHSASESAEIFARAVRSEA